jgi:hypothetical protein
MPRGNGAGPCGRGAGAGIGILSGVTGIVWALLKKYKRAGVSNSFQGSTVQSHFGKEGGVEEVGVSAPIPQVLSPVSTPGNLDDLKKNEDLKEQLDRITERLAKLEAKK